MAQREAGLLWMRASLSQKDDPCNHSKEGKERKATETSKPTKKREGGEKAGKGEEDDGNTEGGKTTSQRSVCVFVLLVSLNHLREEAKW
jgi:hypothetical protein